MVQDQRHDECALIQLGDLLEALDALRADPNLRVRAAAERAVTRIVSAEM